MGEGTERDAQIAASITESRPPIKRWCGVCIPYGRRRGWSDLFLLVSPSRTAHYQKVDGTEATICGLDATGDKWWWPV